VCTSEICQGGACTHPAGNENGPCDADGDCCTEDYCLGGVCRHDMLCAPPCHGCVNNGFLSPGTIEVEPEVACVGSTITFTVTNVDDTGGLKRVCCDNVVIADVEPTYTWVISKPDDSNVYGSGSVAAVVADDPGLYSCTFVATANRECPPQPITVGPESASTCDSESAVAGAGLTCGIEVVLKEITFTSDHTMYEDAPPCDPVPSVQCWGAGAALGGVDWASENNPDHPIAYTRGTPMVLTVRIEARGGRSGTATLRVFGPDGITGEGTFPVPCGTEFETRYVNITTETLLSEVRAYEPMTLQWSVRPPGETQYQPVGATQHDIYATYATPVTVVTPYRVPPDSSANLPSRTRLSFLCRSASTARNDLSVTDKVREGLDADPPNDKPDWLDPRQDSADWFIMHPDRIPSGAPTDIVYVGECDEQAYFMDRAVVLLGGPAGVVYLTWPSPLGDCNPAEPEPFNPVRRVASEIDYIYWDIDGDGTFGEENLMLRFDFDGGTGTDINAFEGSIGYPWIPKYYSVWPSHAADTQCWLLWQLRPPNGTAVQCWARDEGGVNPVTGNPYRWECIRDPNGTLVAESFPDCVPGCP